MLEDNIVLLIVTPLSGILVLDIALLPCPFLLMPLVNTAAKLKDELFLRKWDDLKY